MFVSAHGITLFQTCPRKWALMDKGEVGQWHAPALYSRILRETILELSRGGNLEQLSLGAAADFMNQAREPGLMVSPGQQPYSLAADFCAILKTSLWRISASLAGPLDPGPLIVLAPGLEWKVNAFSGQDGRLHTWRTVEHFDADVLSRELHSWYCFGDLAATGQPMTIHFVEIGRRSGNHQVTPWCRTFSHPVMPKRFAFQKKDGTHIGRGWKAVWYADSSRNDPETWCSLMERDGVDLLKNAPVRPVSAEQGREFKRQVLMEAARMQMVRSTDWRALPMTRGACDLPAPCLFQHRCYSSGTS